MVALLVQLKLTLLRNSLRRSVWRTVGLILAAVYALGIVVFAVIGLVALRWTSTTTTAHVTVLAYSALTLGWLVLSLLVFGVDETVDPGRFALLPVRARELLPGLLVGAAIGVPGVATTIVGLGLVVTWARTPALTFAALVAAALGVPTCLLLARATTSAFASFLASRRFRDLAAVVLALVGAGFGLGTNLLSRAAAENATHLDGIVGVGAAITGWTPFGWAWAIPADVARGAWAAAAVHLLLAAALVVGLWFCWGHFLALRLIEPGYGASSSSGHVGHSGRLERLFPTGVAGAVALRCLRYWRRDSRHLASLASLLVAPIVLLGTFAVSSTGISGLAPYAPCTFSLLIGSSVAQDLCFDGSAVWAHVTAGISGADDRRGRVLAALTLFLPLVLVLHLIASVATGAWSTLPAALGLSLAWLLGGLGVGSVVGAIWQWPAPAPGANPFQRGNAGGLPAVLSGLTVLAGTGLADLPALALVLVGALRDPGLGWLALPIGLVTGLALLQLGLVRGGRILERRWPEVLLAVSDRTA